MIVATIKVSAVLALGVSALATGCVRGYPQPTGSPEQILLANAAVRPTDFEEHYVSFVGRSPASATTPVSFKCLGVALATPEPSIVYLIGCLTPEQTQMVAQLQPATHVRVEGTVRTIRTQYGNRALVYATRIEPTT